MSTRPTAERFSRIAELMQARLQDWPALGGAPVVVDRQADIEADIAEGIAKAAGLVIVLLFEGFVNDNLESDVLAPALRYSIRTYGMPVVAEAAGDFVPAETACIEAAKALHGWKPEGEAADLWSRLEVGRADLEPDTSYIIYAATATLKRCVL